MTEIVSLTATVRGRVQGVFFRAFVQRHARLLGISGYVRNLPDGDVKVQAEGEKLKLERLVDYLRSGSPASRVEEVIVEWSVSTGKYTGFHVTY